jgi:hypothetical protein
VPAPTDPIGGKPTPEAAWSGFLAPETRSVRPDPEASSRAGNAVDELESDTILGVLSDGGQHPANEVRVATGLPTLRFARTVAALEDAKLVIVSVNEDKDEEYLQIAPRARRLSQPS